MTSPDTDPIRVAHFVHHLALGGLETQVLRQIEATPADAVDYTVCYFGEDDSLQAKFEDAGARVVHLDTGSASPAAKAPPASDSCAISPPNTTSTWSGPTASA